MPSIQETPVPSSIPVLGSSPGEGIGYPLQYSWASLVAQLVKNLPAMQETWVGEFPWRRDRLPTPGFLGFPSSSDGKESTCNGGDLGLIPGLRRSPGGGHGNPIQYSCLENPHDQRNPAGCSSQGHKESDMTERLSLTTDKVSATKDNEIQRTLN